MIGLEMLGGLPLVQPCTSVERSPAALVATSEPRGQNRSVDRVALDDANSRLRPTEVRPTAWCNIPQCTRTNA